MKKLIIIALVLFLGNYLQAQTIEPVEQTVGKLHISVDPKMELLSTIQLLAKYQFINRKIDYSNEISSHFADFSKYEAVTLTDELLNNHGFAYDAPVNLMLYLSQIPELKQQSNYSDYLIKRAGGKKNLENYRVAISDFSKEANFKEFWDSQKEFYQQIIDLTVQEVGNQDLVKVIEDYFNETQNSYNIILSPSFHGGYGPRMPAENGKYDIYSCMTTTNEKNGIPYVNLEYLKYYVWHEFGHSFVNPLTEKYLKKIASSKKLFEPISQTMDKMAYGTWNHCVNEHIIRAINVRLYEQNIGEKEAKRLLNSELSQKFIYIEPIIEKLKEFEFQRDNKNITFSDFYPQFVLLFDSLVKVEYWKSVSIPFMGPINAVAEESKRAWIYPTNDEDIAALKIAQDYVSAIYNRFKKKDDLLLADTAALNMSLSDYGITAYGTIESNLFLTKYKSSFPFKIEDNTLYADDEYDYKNLRFITCLPSPLNPERGMSIYTAFSNENIRGINSIFHGWQDYIICTDPETVLGQGYYNKTNEWKFEK